MARSRAVTSESLVAVEFNLKSKPEESASDMGTAIGDKGTYEAAPRTAMQTESVPADPVVKPASPRTISGGVLNGKAVRLPTPTYPEGAMAVGALGSVVVQVLIAEDGTVYSANAVSGHPLLRIPARNAACYASFSPVVLGGVPLRVSGVLTYNFNL